MAILSMGAGFGWDDVGESHIDDVFTFRRRVFCKAKGGTERTVYQHRWEQVSSQSWSLDLEVLDVDSAITYPDSEMTEQAIEKLAIPGTAATNSGATPTLRSQTQRRK